MSNGVYGTGFQPVEPVENKVTPCGAVLACESLWASLAGWLAVRSLAASAGDADGLAQDGSAFGAGQADSEL